MTIKVDRNVDVNREYGKLNNRNTGFSNRTDSQMSFVDLTRTFTIEPVSDNFIFYSAGKKFKKTLAQTVQITDTEGLWYIYFNISGTLVASQTPWEFDDGTVFTSLVYWDATNNLAIGLGDERHGLTMDWATHQYLHETVGAVWESGITPSVTVDGNGSLDAHAEMQSVSAGEIHDEDIEHEHPEQTSYYIWYLNGANSALRRTSSLSAALVDVTATRPNWNEFTGGAWQRTEASNTNFILMHLFSTNSDRPATPNLIAMGQNEYTTKGLAQTGAQTEINSLVTGAAPTVEFVPIATFIIECKDSFTNSYNARVVSTEEGADFVDWRVNERTGSGAVVSDHGNLTGLMDDDHVQYILANGTRAIQPIVDSTTAFQFKDQAGNVDFNYDSTNGFIGIGTNSPEALLHVAEGNIVLGRNDDVSRQFQIKRAGTTRGGFNTNFGDFTFTSFNNHNIRFLDTAANTWLFLEDGGNVGIGTVTPTAELQMGDSIIGEQSTMFGASTYGGLLIAPGKTTGSIMVEGQAQADFILSDVSASVDDKLMVLRNNDGITKFASANDAFTAFIQDNILVMNHSTGNVGIGTAAPGAKLEVNGNINVGGDLGSFGGDDNMLRPTAGSAFLNLKGGTGNAKMVIANSAIDLISSNDAFSTITFRTGATSSTNTGNVRMTIDPAGNVGIGTDSPSTKLHIDTGSAGSVDNLRSSMIIDDTIQNFPGVILRSTSGKSAILSNNGELSFWNDNQGAGNNWESADRKMTLDVNGNVGIGLTNPQRRLVVYDTNPAIHLQNVGSGTSSTDGLQVGLDAVLNAYLWNYENGPLIFGANDNEAMRILANGYVGIGITAPNRTLHLFDTVNPGFIATHNSGKSYGMFAGTTGVALDYDSTGSFSIRTNSKTNIDAGTTSGATTRLTILSDGNVGIGKSDPASDLDVVGDIRETGSFLFEGAGTHYIKHVTGTAASDKFTFRFQDNQDVLTIRGDGNVGIGTVNPVYKLDIDAEDDHTALRISSDSTIGDLRLRMSQTNANQDWNIVVQRDNGNWFLQDATAGTFPFVIENNASDFSIWIKDNGYIGLGTSTPLATLDVRGGNIRSLSTKIADYTITSDDYTILADATNNTVTITLPLSPNQGQVFNIKCIDSTNTCTVTRNGNNIDGAANDISLVATDNVPLQFDSVYGWSIL